MSKHSQIHPDFKPHHIKPNKTRNPGHRKLGTWSAEDGWGHGGWFNINCRCGFRGCTEAPKEGSSRKSADPVPWHILAHLGTSWHILAPCTMLRAGTVQRYFDVGGAKSSCTPGIFDKKLRSCVAKMLSCRTRPGRSFFGDERLPFEIPKMHCGGLDSDWASHMGYTWKLEGQT